MMVSRIDPELLIPLIEERPLIWDNTLETYKNKKMRYDAWREICNHLNRDFEDMTKIEKDKYAKIVVKKWNQLRDSFIRSLNTRKSIKSGLVSLKKYRYHKEMLFLKKILIDPEANNATFTNDSDTSDESSQEENVLESSIDQNEHKFTNIRIIEPIAHESTETTRQKNAKRFKNKINNEDEIPESSINYNEQIDPIKNESTKQESAQRLNSEVPRLKRKIAHKNESHQYNSLNENRHMCFFKSLLPSLARLNEDQILEFQAGVISSIQTLRRQENERDFLEASTSYPSTRQAFFTPEFRGRSSPSTVQSDFQPSDDDDTNDCKCDG